MNGKLTSKKFLKRLIIFSVNFWLLAFPARVWAFRFAVVGDTRSGHSTHYKVVRGIIKKIPNNERVTVLNSGDITAHGSISEWKTFRDIVDSSSSYPESLEIDWSAGSPPQYIGAPGNHDKVPGSGEDWVQNWATYLPNQKNRSAFSGISGDPQGLYGSARYQNAVWIWITDVKQIPSGQTGFLSATLDRAKADASVDWIFVVFHRPPVACGGGHGDTSSNKTLYDNYFVPAGVDIVFVGHNHLYERTCPFLSANSEQCDSNNLGDNIGNTAGVITVVSGGGGASLYTPKICPWIQKDEAKKYHFMEIDIQGGVLDAKVWSISDWDGSEAFSESKHLIDHFVIRKQAGPTATPGPPASPTPTPTRPAGKDPDFDGNGQVDGQDMKQLLAVWGAISPTAAEDLDENSRVNGLDAGVVMANWTGGR